MSDFCSSVACSSQKNSSKHTSACRLLEDAESRLLKSNPDMITLKQFSWSEVNE